MLRVAAILLIGTGAAFAGTSTWTGAIDSDFNKAGNWSAGVPNDIAQLPNIAKNFLFVSADTTINTLSILSGAPAYSITANDLNIAGAGIQNASANPLTLSGTVTLTGTASAGSGTLIQTPFNLLGFRQQSTAASATIQNSGFVYFEDNANAGTANITTASGAGLAFYNGTSLSNATFLNHGNFEIGAGTNLGVPTITTDGASATTRFSSTRGGGITTFTNSNGGILTFDNASAGHATINNTTNGQTQFINGGSAGTANITNNAGRVAFSDTSDGATAALFNVGVATLDVTGVTMSSFTIGSISGSGTVLIGSHTFGVGGNGLSTTFSGTINGTGGRLLKTGSGDLTLSGVNTYTGGTAVENGTLRISNDANLGASMTTITLNNGGTLDMGSGLNLARPIQLAGNGIITTGVGTSTLSGSISGPGGLTLTGAAGIVNLATQSDYTGRTTIDGVTVRLNTEDALPQGGKVTITNTSGSILDLNGQSVQLSELSGVGQVRMGTGTVTLGNGFSNYLGSITGTGRIIIQSGAAILANVSSTTVTEIRQATLFSYGSLGDVYIEGGALQVDTVSSLQNIVNHRSFYVGDFGGRSITATNYSGGGAMWIIMSGTIHSTFTITGQADLTEGQLGIENLYSDQASGDYLIIQADSIVGRFSQEPMSSIFKQYETVYSSSEVHVVITIPNVTHSSFAASRNQRAVAATLDAARNDFNTQEHSAQAESWLRGAPTVSAAQDAYGQLSGDALASFQDIGLRHAASVTDVLRGRVEEFFPTVASTAPVEADRIWAKAVGFYDRTKADSDIGSPSSNSSTAGFQAGYDILASDQLRLGITAGYLKSNVSIDERFASGDVASTETGLYASYIQPRWFLDGAIDFVGTHNQSTRQIDFTVINPGSFVTSALQSTQTSSFPSHSVNAMIETGRWLRPRSSISLQPTAALRWSHLRQDNFIETASRNFGLMVDAVTLHSLVSTLGVRASSTLGEKRTHPLQLGTRIDWQHELLNPENQITSRMDQTGTPITAQATPRDRNAAVLSFDAKLAMSQSTQAFIDYQFTVGDRHQAHGLFGGASVKW